MHKPQALVLTGDGLNCEQETARAFVAAGAEAHIMHINDWLQRPKVLLEYQLLGLPGGFSYGDYLGAGKVLALKIQQGALDELQEFIAGERRVIAICNGLQLLLHLGLLPAADEESLEPTMALAANRDGTFIDRWQALRRNRHSRCWWTAGLGDEELSLPIRHGEGRFVFGPRWGKDAVAVLEQRGQVALQYCDDINGSVGRIAGISNPRGNVLGLMPHPECALRSGFGVKGDGGLAIFRSGVQYTP